MKYIALLDKTVIDVLESDSMPQYPDTIDGEKIQVVEVESSIYPYTGLIYENGEFFDPHTMKKVDVSKEKMYNEPILEPTRLDKIEANLDYLVLINS